ncbi:MAG: MotA/TolQ/ExbB proton channel family protein [Gammaproteobacteria bacterium]|nr:MotA/TolQ/ExbB proton channel family protein [Gammaproteobacteria bacterium]
MRLRHTLHTAVAIAVFLCASIAVAQDPAATDPAAAPAGSADPFAGAADASAGMTDPMSGAAPAADPMATAAPAAGESPADIEAPVADTELVENPYGLQALWAQGDFVAKGTLMILVIMSVFSWYILFAKLIYQQRLITQFKVVGRQFWTASSLKDGASKLNKENVYRMVVEDALGAASHHEGKLTDQIDLHEWVTMSLQRAVESVNSELQTGLAFLATVGSTAPFVGLFGTVWGIYHALIAIGIAGQASIDKVAGPVGEALIMTALGLAVAVPAVLSYNWLVRRNKVALENLRNFSSDVHAVLLSGRRVAAAQAGGR